MSDRVTVRMDGGVADVRLVRADKMNALDSAMFDALIATGEELKTQKGLRIFLRDTRPLDSIVRRLQTPENDGPAGSAKVPASRQSGEGDVSLVMLLDFLPAQADCGTVCW